MKPPNPRGGLPLERSAFENMYRPAPVFRPAGFTPPSELDAASELRLLRWRRETCESDIGAGRQIFSNANCFRPGVGVQFPKG